jgi:hypothetical protein
VLTLADAQASFRQALIAPDGAPPAMLVAPVAAAARFAIYRRHFREALVRHIAGRFPTVEWLLGSPRLWALADEFVRVSPPATPCMAEYGDAFITVLEHQSPAYLRDVAELDWHLGTVAVAISRPAIAIAALGAIAPEQLADSILTLQPGLHHFRSAWPIDDLVRVRLGGDAPAQLAFTLNPVALEVHGARGQFRITRLASGAYAFRAAAAAGASLAEAAECGAAAQTDFDVSSALAQLFADGLVTGVAPNPRESQHDQS